VWGENGLKDASTGKRQKGMLSDGPRGTFCWKKKLIGKRKGVDKKKKGGRGKENRTRPKRKSFWLAICRALVEKRIENPNPGRAEKKRKKKTGKKKRKGVPTNA